MDATEQYRDNWLSEESSAAGMTSASFQPLAVKPMGRKDQMVVDKVCRLSVGGCTQPPRQLICGRDAGIDVGRETRPRL